MKKIVLMNFVVSIFIFTSCSHITWKDGWGSTPKTDEESLLSKPAPKELTETLATNEVKSTDDNWANEYYQKTYFIVNNPRILETKKEIDKICDSQDLLLSVDYQHKEANTIALKKDPITISTVDGFSKKVLISKGVCRELALFKSIDLKQNRQIRKSIKKVVLSYVYNKGTYLKEVIFNTPFKSVEFLVE